MDYAKLRKHLNALATLPKGDSLVELKDRFNRFVVVLATKESARIVEMNLGALSVELLTERPALRERIGREWTREHYVNHRRQRERRFVKEKVSVIESLMAKRGHNALIIGYSILRAVLPKTGGESGQGPISERSGG